MERKWILDYEKGICEVIVADKFYSHINGKHYMAYLGRRPDEWLYCRMDGQFVATPVSSDEYYDLLDAEIQNYDRLLSPEQRLYMRIFNL